jgi:hypothetical protein
MSAQDIFLRFDVTSFLQKLTINRQSKNFISEAYNFGGLGSFPVVLCLFRKFSKKA